MQLAHAGRKASTDAPWRGGSRCSPVTAEWQPVAPSPIPFDTGYPIPREMTAADIEQLVEDFAASTRLAIDAGFEVIELHMAHGYLLHEFLSPLSNHRRDEYGGSLRSTACVFPSASQARPRRSGPSEFPLFVRISATDWAEGGWDLPQSIELGQSAQGPLGVDLIDCSSGALVPHVKIPAAPAIRCRSPPPSAASRNRHGGCRHDHRSAPGGSDRERR